MTRPRIFALPLILTAALGLGCSEPPQGLIVLPGSRQGAPETSTAAIVERPFFHDFGQVPYGERAVHTFEMLNTERVPITIRKAQAGCSCTLPTLEAIATDGSVIKGDPAHAGELLVIPPGARARLTARVDTTAVRVANTDKLVILRLTTDSERTPFVKFELHLEVVRAFALNPARLDFGRVPAGRGGRAALDLVAQGAADERPGAVASAPAGMTVDVLDNPQRPGSAWIVAGLIAAGQTPGSLVGEIRVDTQRADGSAGRGITIPYQAQIVPDLEFRPGQLTLRPQPGGTDPEHTVRIESHLPDDRFRIARVEVEGELRERLAIDSVAVQPDDAGASSLWDVTLRLAPGEHVPRFAGELIAVLDGDPAREVKIPYVGIFE